MPKSKTLGWLLTYRIDSQPRRLLKLFYNGREEARQAKWDLEHLGGISEVQGPIRLVRGD